MHKYGTDVGGVHSISNVHRSINELAWLLSVVITTMGALPSFYSRRIHGSLELSSLVPFLQFTLKLPNWVAAHLTGSICQAATAAKCTKADPESPLCDQSLWQQIPYVGAQCVALSFLFVDGSNFFPCVTWLDGSMP